MLKKAAIIETIFFCAAAVLVLSSILLVGYIGSEGLRLFQTMSPVAFFTGTTWNPNLLKDDSTDTGSTDAGSTVAVAVATEAAATPEPGLAAPAPTGALIQDGQVIEPSQPAEGEAQAQPSPQGQFIQDGQVIEPSQPAEGQAQAEATPQGQLMQDGQVIEPSQPAAGEAQAADTPQGQLVQDGQLIEPSQPAEGDASTGATAAQQTAALVTAEPAAAEPATVAAAAAPAKPNNSINDAFGLLPLLLGSLLTAFITLVFSAPLAIMVATFMVEVAPEPMRRIMRSTVEIFAALPSVIFGLLGLMYIVPWVRETFSVGLGKGILAASIVLVFMTQPTIVLIAEDALRSVPRSLREAAWGVGATHWQMIWGILLPSARAGLFTAVILGMGRAIGETMAVQMVIGNITEHIPTSLVEGATTMPAAIVTQLPEAASPEHRAALIMVAFVLLIISFILISLARYTIRKSTPVR